MGNYLTTRRKELGLTMKQVAEAVGVSEATVSRWESGEIANMRRDRISKYAEVLNVRPTYIMTGEKEESSPLTPKDERDIAKDLDALMDKLASGEALMFDGDPMTPEAIESIKAAMKLGLEAAKLKNKERFTPKKHRKESD